MDEAGRCELPAEIFSSDVGGELFFRFPTTRALDQLRQVIFQRAEGRTVTREFSLASSRAKPLVLPDLQKELIAVRTPTAREFLGVSQLGGGRSARSAHFRG